MPSPDAALEIRTVANDPVPIRVRASGAWTFSGLKERRDQLAHDLAPNRRLAEVRQDRDPAGVSDRGDGLLRPEPFAPHVAPRPVPDDPGEGVLDAAREPGRDQRPSDGRAAERIVVTELQRRDLDIDRQPDLPQ